MYRSVRNLAFAIAILTAPALADEWPDSLKKALAKQSNQATYSYMLRFESSDDTEEVSYEVLIDPSRPPDERRQILSLRPGSESGDDVELRQEIDEHVPEKIWCSAVADAMPKNVAVVEESADILVVRFRPKFGKQDIPNGMRKLFKKLEGEIVIDKNTMTVRSYRLHNRKHVRVMFVAKIRRFLVEMECELAPNGDSYASKQIWTLEIGAFGQRRVSTATTLISNLTPVQMYDATSKRSR